MLVVVPVLRTGDGRGACKGRWGPHHGGGGAGGGAHGIGVAKHGAGAVHAHAAHHGCGLAHLEPREHLEQLHAVVFGAPVGVVGLEAEQALLHLALA